MSQPTVATELPEQLLRAACAQLRHDLRNGQTCRSEDLLQQFPELAVHPEAALELVYTEFVVREELGQQSSLAQRTPRGDARCVAENACTQQQFHLSGHGSQIPR